ncbi:MarR family winged helix-turn-helix transcriptional regulator [Roseibium aggregatum]|uniref:Winged helix-turn-helix transcriptional regulator n=1 Tax=Roseibium aggregatum TaxID=187304 RepID=A0A939EFD9_9HYPH|nr:MarR family transcriptional regulator [Roseibium aggregatum]MBN9672227.1 winged helix-turn-helix transcriptional regulator [Roseibium aggregatum]
MTDQADKTSPEQTEDTGPGPVGTDRRHGYVLDEQIGYLLRKAYQRNAVLFGDKVKDLTPTQFAVMARLTELGSVSQNQLGRTVGLDVATTKGVVDRLSAQGLLSSERDPNDRRRQLISLTDKGWSHFVTNAEVGLEVSAETLAPLTASEQRNLLRILKKIQ